MIADLMDLMFGCVHSDYSWPQKYERGDYVACLTCGKEFTYCTNQMKVLGPLTRVTSSASQYQGNSIDDLMSGVDNIVAATERR